jgi:hypothetical protein
MPRSDTRRLPTRTAVQKIAASTSHHAQTSRVHSSGPSKPSEQKGIRVETVGTYAQRVIELEPAIGKVPRHLWEIDDRDITSICMHHDIVLVQVTVYQAACKAHHHRTMGDLRGIRWSDPQHDSHCASRATWLMQMCSNALQNRNKRAANYKK